MWQLLQRVARTPVLNVVRRAGTHERPPPDVVTQFTTQVKKHPELLPILGIVAFSTSWAIYNIFHAINTKADVRFNKYNRKKPPWEKFGPTQKTKLYTPHPEYYIPIPELEAIKNDIGKDEEPSKPC
ncbi:hypothetical protein BsWGS_11323 [Bradybaena similaris]